MDRIPTVLTTVGDPPVEIVINQRDYDPVKYGPQRILNPGLPDERVLVVSPPAESSATTSPLMAEVEAVSGETTLLVEESMAPDETTASAVKTSVPPSIPVTESVIVRSSRHDTHRKQRPGKRR